MITKEVYNFQRKSMIEAIAGKIMGHEKDEDQKINLAHDFLTEIKQSIKPGTAAPVLLNGGELEN